MLSKQPLVRFFRTAAAISAFVVFSACAAPQSDGPGRSDSKTALEQNQETRDSAAAPATPSATMFEADAAEDFIAGVVDREIYGGTDVEPGDYLSTIRISAPGAFLEGEAAIGNPTRGKSGQRPTVCTGVLLSASVGITAGHCLKLLDSRPEISIGPVVAGNGADRSYFKVSLIAGPDAIAALPNELSENISWTSIRMKEHNLKEEVIDRVDVPDIALFQIEGLPAEITAATIAKETQMGDRGYARIVGYGLTESGDLGAKKFADVRVVSPKCERKVSKFGLESSVVYGCKKGSEIVAGAVKEIAESCSLETQFERCVRRYTEQKLTDLIPERCSRETLQARAGGQLDPACADTCGGDSGGPLFVATAGNRLDPKAHVDAMEAGRYALAGITSRAVDTMYVSAHEIVNSKGTVCGNGGIYTRLSGPTLIWINKQMKCWEAGGYLELNENESLPLTSRFVCERGT